MHGKADHRIHEHDFNARMPSKHCSGLDSDSADPIFGFTWSHRESWIDDIGKNVYARIKNDKELVDAFGMSAYNKLWNDKGFIEEIGAFAAASLKKEMSSFMPS